MDREQFRKIFDELDKDRIKEVEMSASKIHLTFPFTYTSIHLYIYIYNVCVCLQHPPLPQYQSPVLQKLQVVFSHYFLTILGNAVALANVICICVSCTLTHTHTCMYTCIQPHTLTYGNVTCVCVFQTVLVLNAEKSAAERDNYIIEVNSHIMS